MKRTVIPIIGLILLVGVVSALNITAGDEISFSIDTTNTIYWDVVGNSSDMNGLRITQEVFSDYSNITIEIEYWFAPDNFTLIFFDVKKEVETIEVHVGGGGGRRTIYEDRNITEYVDRNITTIVEKEVPEEIKKISFPIIFLIILLIIAIIHSITVWYTNKRESKSQ